MARESHEVTQYLVRWSRGDQSALAQLTPLVYRELRRVASHYLRAERRDHTLQPTALVHEAYVRLIEVDQPEWDSRNHFYAFAARLMRQVLVDYARKHAAAKRDGGIRIPIAESTLVVSDRMADLLCLDQVLTELAEIDSRKSRIIELRYFAGMGVEETSRAMDLSVATIRRELRMAEAWLNRAMSGRKAEKHS
jgi:RNA polymerase sigma factor (TIGR02999 family)